MQVDIPSWLGFKVNVKAIPIFHSLFFPIYETAKEQCIKRGYPRWKEYIVSTIIAGGLVNFFTNPIWIVRTRIMVQALHHKDYHYNSDSIIKIAMQMVK